MAINHSHVLVFSCLQHSVLKNSQQWFPQVLRGRDVQGTSAACKTLHLVNGRLCALLQVKGSIQIRSLHSISGCSSWFAGYSGVSATQTSWICVNYSFLQMWLWCALHSTEESRGGGVTAPPVHLLALCK